MSLDSSLPSPSVLPALLAAVAGMTLIWYDFYLFGALATTVAPRFFPRSQTILAQIGFFSTLVVGLMVRPVGALLFGKIGDMRGRKAALSLSLLLTSMATISIAVLPGYAMIGGAAPIALILFRVLQGLSFGGAHAAAQVYVAESVPVNRRGFYASFVQIAPTLGLVLSVGAILVVQHSLDDKSFKLFGWRYTFLPTVLLIGLWLYVHFGLSESRVFSKLKERGTVSTRPVMSALGRANMKSLLRILFGAIAIQACLWYVVQLYALFHLQNILKVKPSTATGVVALGHLLATPFFIFFGALSDRLGRKKIILGGCLFAAVLYLPIYKGMQYAAGTNVVKVATVKNPVTGIVGPSAAAIIDGNLQPVMEASNPNVCLLVGLVFLQVVFLAAVAGPLGAYGVESFAPEVRYTSAGLAYSLGNGTLGGLLPLISLPLIVRTGNIYAGLYFVMGLTLAFFLIGVISLKETALSVRR